MFRITPFVCILEEVDISYIFCFIFRDLLTFTGAAMAGPPVFGRIVGAAVLLIWKISNRHSSVPEIFSKGLEPTKYTLYDGSRKDRSMKKWNLTNCMILFCFFCFLVGLMKDFCQNHKLNVDKYVSFNSVHFFCKTHFSRYLLRQILLYVL